MSKSFLRVLSIPFFLILGLHSLNAQCGLFDNPNLSPTTINGLSQEWSNFDCGNQSFEIPVDVIILRGNSVVSYPSWGSIPNLLNLTNSYFGGRFEFYVASTHVATSNNYAVNLDLSTGEDVGLYNLYHNDNAINLYIVEKATTDGSTSTLRVYSKYNESYAPSCPNNNFIVLSTLAPASDVEMSKYLAHELGKYFGLLPTSATQNLPFNNCNLFDPQNDSPALSGDLIEDTAFEPEGTGCTPPDCNSFTCTKTCPISSNSYNYTFDPSNLMSKWFANCATPHLTIGQLDRMCFFLYKDRNYLLNPSAPLPGPFADRGRVERECDGMLDPMGFRNITYYFDQGIQADNFASSTNSLGYYRPFGIVSNNHDEVKIKLSKTGIPTNGVDVNDIKAVAIHLLGGAQLSPLNMIAADVNYSGTITTFDIVMMRKLILGEISTFPNVGEWRYIPKMPFVTSPSFATQFNSSNPFAAIWIDPQGVTRMYYFQWAGGTWMDELNLDFDNPNFNLGSEDTWSFYTLKAGDVNCSASSDGLANVNGGIDVATDAHAPVYTNDIITLEVKGCTGNSISAYQFPLKYDNQKLTIIGVESGDMPFFSFDNFNLSSEGISNGDFRTLWYSPSGSPVSLSQNKVLFKIRFKANSNIANIGDLIDVDGDMLSGFFTQSTTEPTPATLTFHCSTTSPNQHFLNSVYPSPFGTSVSFLFSLYQSTQIDVTLSDGAGHSINQQAHSSSGSYILTFNNVQSLNDGIIYYSAQVGSQIFSGTLVKNN